MANPDLGFETGDYILYVTVDRNFGRLLGEYIVTPTVNSTLDPTILDKSNEKLRPPFSSIAMMEKCFASFALRLMNYFLFCP